MNTDGRRLRYSRWAITAGVVVVAGVVGWIWWAGRAERHLAEARQLLAAGEVLEALGRLEVPERSAATRREALLLRAQAAIQRGRPSDAVGPLNQIEDAGPAIDAEVAFWKGRALHAAGQSAQAVRWLERAAEGRPKDAETHRWLAAAAYDLGDRVTTIAALEALTRLEPGDRRAWRTLGLLHKENVDFERADFAYAKALALDGNQRDVEFERAQVLAELGRWDEAEELLERCRGGVAEADRIEVLAGCVRARGDIEAARKMVDEALVAAPDHAGLLASRGGLALAEGDAAGAVTSLDRAIALDPYRANWVFQRSQALRRLGRVDEAQRDEDRAAELNRLLAEMAERNDEAARRPEDAGVRYRIAEICKQLGQRELAASWFRAALACDARREGSGGEAAARGTP